VGQSVLLKDVTVQHYLGSIIMGILVAVILIAGCVYLLFRTPKIRGYAADAHLDPRDSAEAANEEHERQLALENLATASQIQLLRRNGSLGP
jgi:hypothetical protein